MPEIQQEIELIPISPIGQRPVGWALLIISKSLKAYNGLTFGLWTKLRMSQYKGKS
jgi:hypothetical protein